MELIFPILTGVLMLVAGLPLYLYANETARFSKPARLVIKSAITFFGGTLALAGALRSGFAFAYLAAAGLLVCAAADTLLEIKFFVGGSFFAAGHILYIASFLTRTRPGALSVPAFCAGAILLVLLVYKMRPLGNLKYFVPAYGAVIVTMTAFALPLAFYAPPWFYRGDRRSAFFVSDSILALNIRFGGSAPPARPSCSPTPRPIPACAVGLPCLPVGLKPRLRIKQPAFGGLSMYPIFRFFQSRRFETCPCPAPVRRFLWRRPPSRQYRSSPPAALRGGFYMHRLLAKGAFPLTIEIPKSVSDILARLKTRAFLLCRRRLRARRGHGVPPSDWDITTPPAPIWCARCLPTSVRFFRA